MKMRKFNEILNKLSPDSEEVEKIKRIMGTETKVNSSFFIKMLNMGISPLNFWPVWEKIYKEVKVKLYKGLLEPQDIQVMINQLLLENRTSREIIQQEKLNQKLVILGITEFDFRCKLFADTESFNKENENKNFIDGYCYIQEEKIIIKRIELNEQNTLDDKIIPFVDITSVDFQDLEKLSYMTSIVINLIESESISLLYTTEENYKQITEAWLNFKNKFLSP